MSPRAIAIRQALDEVLAGGDKAAVVWDGTRVRVVNPPGSGDEVLVWSVRLTILEPQPSQLDALAVYLDEQADLAKGHEGVELPADFGHPIHVRTA